MTRKDYELIASRIKQQADEGDAHQLCYLESRDALGTLKDLAMCLATDFQQSNPRFQPARFMAACGFPAEDT